MACIYHVFIPTLASQSRGIWDWPVHGPSLCVVLGTDEVLDLTAYLLVTEARIGCCVADQVRTLRRERDQGQALLPNICYMFISRCIL
jgi:hypothetical protein